MLLFSQALEVRALLIDLTLFLSPGACVSAVSSPCWSCVSYAPPHVKFSFIKKKSLPENSNTSIILFLVFLLFFFSIQFVVFLIFGMSDI